MIDVGGEDLEVFKTPVFLMALREPHRSKRDLTRPITHATKTRFHNSLSQLPKT